jgi:hypothetical protein
VYSLTQRRLRQQLADHNATIPNQIHGHLRKAGHAGVHRVL